jgi:predicted nicotinamide N-methyase
MATDGSEAIVTKIRRNFELNDVVADTSILWWGENNEILDKKWDFIIGADITYDKDICSDLAETYSVVVKRGSLGILAATVRNENTLMAFVHECRKVI